MKLNLDNNTTIGHKMPAKEENQVQICVVNLNGISMSNQAEQFQELCDNVNLHDIDFLGCSEINLDTMQQEISSLPIPAKYFYKPGGTMCLVQGKISSRKIDQEYDQYERWSYIKSTAAKNKIITMITAYQPCKPTKGT
eukprot:4547352-Ditylum_brightwellii.AAC.1